MDFVISSARGAGWPAEAIHQEHLAPLQDAEAHTAGGTDWIRAAANPWIARVHWTRRLPVVKRSFADKSLRLIGGSYVTWLKGIEQVLPESRRSGIMKHAPG